MENKSKKRKVSSVIVIVIMLIANISNMLGSPTIAAIRPVDIVRLIACGMLIGVLIVNLLISNKMNKE